MAYELFVYLHTDGSTPFNDWYRCKKTIQQKERSKLNQKIDSLILHGNDLRPQTLTDCGQNGVAKLRVHGSVQLRPKLCLIEYTKFNDDTKKNENKTGFVFLLGAKEISSKWHPSSAPTDAKTYRNILIKDIDNRKIDYVRY